MKNKTHYSEADLLETYYTQPGESMPVMMHLADCADCAARYERVERKVRGLAACDHDEKPETFWARQRVSIMRRVAQQKKPRSAVFSRIAAAAVLALALGSVAVWNGVREDDLARPVTTEMRPTATASNETTTTRTTEDTTDPWQSDELKEFGSMVEWESWVENGDQSL